MNEEAKKIDLMNMKKAEEAKLKAANTGYLGGWFGGGSAKNVKVS